MVRFLCRLTLFLAVLCGLGWRTAPLQAEVTMRVETVSAPDKFPIRFSYYPAIADKNPAGLSEAPVVILLHGDNGSRLVWDKGSAPAGKKTFPEILQEEGYATVTVDLRKHGQSVIEGRDDPIQNDDYLKMAAGDLKAVKDFLQTEHQAKNLNMGKMAIVAAGFSAPVATAFAQFDWEQKPYDDSPLPESRTPRGQDVKTIILLSPESTAGRLSLNKSLVYLNKQNLAFLFMVGKQDAADKGAAKNAFKACGADSKKSIGRVELHEPDLKDRGTDMLGKALAVVELPILLFLQKHLKEITVPWVDRRSRLDR